MILRNLCQSARPFKGQIAEVGVGEGIVSGPVVSVKEAVIGKGKHSHCSSGCFKIRECRMLFLHHCHQEHENAVLGRY